MTCLDGGALAAPPASLIWVIDAASIPASMLIESSGCGVTKDCGSNRTEFRELGVGSVDGAPRSVEGSSSSGSIRDRATTNASKPAAPKPSGTANRAIRCCLKRERAF